MALVLVVLLSILASWSLIDFTLMAITSIKGDLIPADLKIVVYFMVKSIATVTLCVMAAIHIAQLNGLMR